MQNFQEIFRIQEDLLERAELFGIPVVDVQDLESAARQVVSYVVDQLGERHAAEARGLD
jgi:2-phosphoglycerate kinase